MANKDLQPNAHRVKDNKEVIKDMCWYENAEGIWIYLNGEVSHTIKWSSIRAALKRKDK